MLAFDIFRPPVACQKVNVVKMHFDLLCNTESGQPWATKGLNASHKVPCRHSDQALQQQLLDARQVSNSVSLCASVNFLGTRVFRTNNLKKKRVARARLPFDRSNASRTSIGFVWCFAQVECAFSLLLHGYVFNHSYVMRCAWCWYLADHRIIIELSIPAMPTNNCGAVFILLSLDNCLNC